MSNYIAWSLSRLQNHEQCPEKFNRLYILKDVKQQPNEHTEYGIHVHEAFENRLKHRKALPNDLLHYEPMMQQIDEQGGTRLVEQQFAIDNNFILIEWFAKNVWLRAINDLTIITGDVAVTLDWKTGKKYKPDARQLMILATILFIKFPSLNKIHSHFYYVKTHETFDQVYYRTNLQGYMDEIANMPKKMQLDWASNTWEVTPSKFACNFCPANPLNTGDCAHAYRA